MSYDWATNKKVIILGAFSGGTATTKPVPHPRGSDQLALPYTVEGKGLRNPHAKFDNFFINVTIVTCFCTANGDHGLYTFSSPSLPLDGGMEGRWGELDQWKVPEY